MAPRGMTGHTGFREQIKKKKKNMDKYHIKSTPKKITACLACFLKKLRIYLWKFTRKVRVTTKSIFLSVIFCFFKLYFPSLIFFLYSGPPEQEGSHLNTQLIGS